MGVFQAFKIVQMLPNYAKHHIRLTNFVPIPNITKKLRAHVPIYFNVFQYSASNVSFTLTPFICHRILERNDIYGSMGIKWVKHTYFTLIFNTWKMLLRSQTEPVFNCSKLIMEISEEYVKFVQI